MIAAAALRVNELQPQNLSNMLWAVATVDQWNEKLLVVLAMAAEWQAGMTVFKLQELNNTAWAFATASETCKKLFAVLARAAARYASEFEWQGLTNTSWAFATVG
eukprot:gnl/TRDRNA2_/TRDRNA2_173840_c5_seq8.p5 gnl/TRDRNA2_/TRDRNA2_173840_c5~~gnl/TRDRNA2_/TRDRNA2_173840_c5_seq8.p5  ORF type:complete len:105 (-),score=23.58 gnl/TRDRNA2_/TRDRNA2_173840_c5_seq8:517-831(-)